MTTTKKTTKICPQCGCSDLSLLHGEDKKLCTGCGHEIDWPLDEGQKSLFKKNVVGEKPQAKEGEVWSELVKAVDANLVSKGLIAP